MIEDSAIPEVSLTVTAYAPSVRANNHKSSPPYISLAATAYAPSIVVNNNESSLPYIGITATAYAPTTLNPNHQFVSAPATAITSALYVPQVNVSANDLAYIPALNSTPILYRPLAATSEYHKAEIPSVNLSPIVCVPYPYIPEESVVGGALWYSVQILLGGTDYTAHATGAITVEEAENSSALCDFTLAAWPAMSLPVTGSAVAIDVNGRRLYTGIVGEYALDPDHGLVSVNATTDLQGKTRAYIQTHGRAGFLGLTGGKWHSTQANKEGDEWEWSQEVMASIPYELHVDRSGQYLAVTPWTGAGVVSITNANRVAGSLRGTLAETSNAVNKVIITVQHRYTVQHYANPQFTWAETLGDWQTKPGWPLPTDEAAVGAVNGTGFICNMASGYFKRPWEYLTGEYLGATHHYTGEAGYHSVEIDPGSWFENYNDKVVAIFPANAICGFALWGHKEWTQQILDTYQITVACQASIDAIGERKIEESYAVESSNDADAQEGQWQTSGMANGQRATGHLDLIDAAVAKARTEIAASHRGHTETFVCPFSHNYRLERRASLSGIVTCEGKISSIRHTLDPEAGEALSEVTISLSGFAGQVASASDAMAIPSAGEAPSGSIAGRTLSTIIGSSGGAHQSAYYAFYHGHEADGDSVQQGFVVEPPAIPASLTDDHENLIERAVAAGVPVDSYAVNWAALACTS